MGGLPVGEDFLRVCRANVPSAWADDFLRVCRTPEWYKDACLAIFPPSQFTIAFEDDGDGGQKGRVTSNVTGSPVVVGDSVKPGTDGPYALLYHSVLNKGSSSFLLDLLRFAEYASATCLEDSEAEDSEAELEAEDRELEAEDREPEPAADWDREDAVVIPTEERQFFHAQPNEFDLVSDDEAGRADVQDPPEVAAKRARFDKIAAKIAKTPKQPKHKQPKQPKQPNKSRSAFQPLALVPSSSRT